MNDFKPIKLGRLLLFANGRSSPARDEYSKYLVYGSNGPIGRADQCNTSKDAIIIGRVGSYCGSLYFTDEPCWVTDNAIRATARGDNCPRFIFYLLGTLGLNNWRSGSGQPLLNQDILNSIPTQAPEPYEQRAIAAILAALDEKIDINRRMNETLEAMARAIFKDWFVDFGPTRTKFEGRAPYLAPEIWTLFPDRLDDEGKPEGWRLGEINDIALVIDCLHSKKPARVDSGKPFLQLWNLRDDGLLDLADTYYVSENDYAEWCSRIEASPGDCVVTNVGRVGAVAQIPEGFKAALGRNMTAVRCRESFPYPTFLVECLRSKKMREEIDRRTDAGTILSSLNVRSIPKLSFVFPSSDLARNFEILTRPIKEKMERNSTENSSLAATRDLLLPKLMSGEIRVKDAEKLVRRWHETAA